MNQILKTRAMATSLVRARLKFEIPPAGATREISLDCLYLTEFEPDLLSL
jgi:hypothetical protein